MAGAGVQHDGVCHQHHRQKEVTEYQPRVEMRENHEGPEHDLAIVGTSPAGYGSTRLAGNPLSNIPGRTLIERRSARASAKGSDRVVGESGMAVDTPEENFVALIDAAERFGTH